MCMLVQAHRLILAPLNGESHCASLKLRAVWMVLPRTNRAITLGFKEPFNLEVRESLMESYHVNVLMSD